VQPTTPEHDDQSAQSPAVTVIVGLAHHDGLLIGARVGKTIHEASERLAGVALLALGGVLLIKAIELNGAPPAVTHFRL
jgi:small neutral amino acid transporter SnatA (MarC family)